jgi:hypothetical protein
LELYTRTSKIKFSTKHIQITTSKCNAYSGTRFLCFQFIKMFDCWEYETYLRRYREERVGTRHRIYIKIRQKHHGYIYIHIYIYILVVQKCLSWNIKTNFWGRQQVRRIKQNEILTPWTDGSFLYNFLLLSLHISPRICILKYKGATVSVVVWSTKLQAGSISVRSLEFSINLILRAPLYPIFLVA